ncbi:MAG: pilus assembly protein TadE [Frankiales bacterium]|nr:pilus assembly protein TadE [Frankiales bacterium]
MTAETAVLLPVLLVVLAVAVGVLASVAAQLRCVDAARGAARVAARGDDAATISTVARRLAPPGASVLVRRSGDSVEVVVTSRVQPFGAALRVLPSVEVQGRAVAAVEESDEAGQDVP